MERTWRMLLVLGLAACTPPANAASPPPPAPPSPPQPASLVLLLDTSARMASQNKQFKLRAALQGWLKYQVPSGILLSLWSYAENGSEEKTVLINDTASREEIMNAIPIRTRGVTCTFCGISSVLKGGLQNAMILLITDGYDKFLEDDLEDVATQLNKSHVLITSLLIGDNTHNNVFHNLSNGRVYHAMDGDTIPALLDAFWHSLHSVNKEYSLPIVIFEDETNKFINGEFFVDKTLTKFSTVCIYFYYWPHDMNISIALTTPHGIALPVPVNSGYSQYCDLYDGLWDLKVNSETFNKFIAVQVAAISIRTNDAMFFSCWFHNSVDNTTKKQLPSLHASLEPRHRYNQKAEIRAEIQESNGNSMILLLQDNGFVAEKQLFSKYICTGSKAGYYRARCWATERIVNGTHSTPSNQRFTRLARTLELQVEDILTALPPLPITDLTLVNISGNMLFLKFTAPDCQLDGSKVLHYTIIISTTKGNHSIGRYFMLSHDPNNSTTEETVQINIPSAYISSPIYISVVAIGTNNVQSEPSNTVFISLQSAESEENTQSPRNKPEVFETSSEAQNDSGEHNSGNNIIFIILGLFGSAALVGLVFFVYRKLKNRYTYDVQNAEIGNFLEDGPG